MIAILTAGLNPSYASGQSRRARLFWIVWFLVICAVTALLGLTMLVFGPNPVIIAWIIFFVGAAAILYQPRYGIYLSLFLALLGDSILLPWYPFLKNFSSTESIFYLNNSLITNPLEIYLGLTLLSWSGRAAVQRKIKFYTGALSWPVMLFMAFVISGLVYGLARGGILNIALWEARPIFYLPVMFVLVSNLIMTRRQVNNLMWSIILAIAIQALIGVFYYLFTLKGNLEGVNSITEHSAAIRMNTFFVFILGAWIYKGSAIKRHLLPWIIPIVLLTYFVTQRRAAFLTLTIALILIAIILYKEHRKVFWIIVPPLVTLFGLYVAVSWNSTSTIALPAQAVKSVVAAEQASYEDQLSNIYRVIENINTSFTIHTVPLTGVGFGNKFYIIAPMADISFFIWWEYITHNSILWMWIKTGFGGFLAMLFLIGYSVIIGARVLLRMPGGDLSAVALTAVIYIVMHFIYAYVDMSWDMQSMLYIGAMMGILNSLEKITWTSQQSLTDQIPVIKLANP